MENVNFPVEKIVRATLYYRFLIGAFIEKSFPLNVGSETVNFPNFDRQMAANGGRSLNDGGSLFDSVAELSVRDESGPSAIQQVDLVENVHAAPETHSQGPSRIVGEFQFLLEKSNQLFAGLR